MGQFQTTSAESWQGSVCDKGPLTLAGSSTLTRPHLIGFLLRPAEVDIRSRIYQTSVNTLLIDSRASSRKNTRRLGGKHSFDAFLYSGDVLNGFWWCRWRPEQIQSGPTLNRVDLAKLHGWNHTSDWLIFFPPTTYPSQPSFRDRQLCHYTFWSKYAQIRLYTPKYDSTTPFQHVTPVLVYYALRSTNLEGNFFFFSCHVISINLLSMPRVFVGTSKQTWGTEVTCTLSSTHK